MNVAPSGQVVGLDMATALKIVEGHGIDLAVAVDLLFRAEAGMMMSLNERMEDE